MLAGKGLAPAGLRPLPLVVAFGAGPLPSARRAAGLRLAVPASGTGSGWSSFCGADRDIFLATLPFSLDIYMLANLAVFRRSARIVETADQADYGQDSLPAGVSEMNVGLLRYNLPGQVDQVLQREHRRLWRPDLHRCARCATASLLALQGRLLLVARDLFLRS